MLWLSLETVLVCVRVNDVARQLIATIQIIPRLTQSVIMPQLLVCVMVVLEHCSCLRSCKRLRLPQYFMSCSQALSLPTLSASALDISSPNIPLDIESQSLFPTTTAVAPITDNVSSSAAITLPSFYFIISNGI